MKQQDPSFLVGPSSTLTTSLVTDLGKGQNNRDIGNFSNGRRSVLKKLTLVATALGIYGHKPTITH